MRTFLFILLALGAKFSFADSPITSTSLHIGYEDNPLVKAAIATKELSKDQLKFFVSSAALPEKLAILSAFGWGNEGSQIFKNLSDGIIAARGGEDKLTVDDNFVLAYAQANDDYFDMSKTNKYFEKIDLQNEKRESALWVFNLCVMQAMLDDMSQWCDIYRRTDALRTLDWIVRDMKPVTMTDGIYSYLDIYKGSCEE